MVDDKETAFTSAPTAPGPRSPATDKWTVEKLAAGGDYIDVRTLQRRGMLSDRWVMFVPMLGWRGIVKVQASRHLVVVELQSGYPGPALIWAARDRGCTAPAGDGWHDCSRVWPVITAVTASTIPDAPANARARQADFISRRVSCGCSLGALLRPSATRRQRLGGPTPHELDTSVGLPRSIEQWRRFRR